MIKRFFLALGFAALTISVTVAQDQGENLVEQEAEAIKVGDDAPDWQMTGSDGNVYKLSDYKGKKGVVVAWYPAALTGG